MTGSEGYRAPAGEARAEIKEKGSRFLAVLRPVTDEAAARAAPEELAAAHPDASHHCPAGEPMLQVLRGAELSDVLAVVIRWFGGVKLGKGGLARAYAGAVREALTDLPHAVRRPTVRLTLEVSFDRLGAVRRLLRPPRVILEGESYGEVARLALRVERRAEAELRQALAGLGVAATAAADPGTSGSDTGDP